MGNGTIVNDPRPRFIDSLSGLQAENIWATQVWNGLSLVWGCFGKDPEVIIWYGEMRTMCVEDLLGNIYLL